MASALIATNGLCGTAVTSFSSSSFIAGNKLHSPRHYGASRIGHASSSRALAAREDQGGKGEKKTEEKNTSLFTSITDALDFAQTRSEKDGELLAEAREATKGGAQMTREQYAALRRKIGGTYKDFFKDSIEVIGDYVDDGWVDKKCRFCKKDTSNEPRTKDSLGRYAHVACMDKEKSGNFFTRLFGK